MKLNINNKLTQRWKTTREDRRARRVLRPHGSVRYRELLLVDRVRAESPVDRAKKLSLRPQRYRHRHRFAREATIVALPRERASGCRADG